MRFDGNLSRDKAELAAWALVLKCIGCTKGLAMCLSKAAKSEIPGGRAMSQAPFAEQTRKASSGSGKRGGRPSAYTQEIAVEICVRLASGEPLTRICRTEGMPSLSMVYRYLLEHDEFREMYARAREDQADTLADQIIELADEEPSTISTEKGGRGYDSAHVNWMRLRVDSRKWIAAKLKPKKYGDKIEVDGKLKTDPVEELMAQVYGRSTRLKLDER